MSDVQQRIDTLVKGHKVVLFMKGTAQFPQCGFSGRAIQILKACGVSDLVTVNVLEDEGIRQGIKEYANWPTIPQLYVNGEFIGGSDIMMEMYQSGELQQELALNALATEAHSPGDVGACIASGSFATDAMVIAPCSMKTLAAVAHGLGDNLLTRAADVTLKERRRLVLMVRETPFNLAHLRNMTAVTEMGGIVFPPLPAFYHRPQSIDELVNDTVERVLQLVGIDEAEPQRWQGL
ncbi:unnamed protein product [Victoria cruziana]